MFISEVGNGGGVGGKRITMEDVLGVDFHYREHRDVEQCSAWHQSYRCHRLKDHTGPHVVMYTREVELYRWFCGGVRWTPPDIADARLERGIVGVVKVMT